MNKANHVTDDLLVRAMDDELPGKETALVGSHLSRCERCTQRYQELRSASLRLESAVAAFVPPHSTSGRESLSRALDVRRSEIALPRPRKVLRQFSWGMGVAAVLALGVLFGPQWTPHAKIHLATGFQDQSSAPFEVDGETFVRLPYSNPDLPLTAPHIVQMQVPVSSLADAGIIFEPISSQISAPDRSVLADVLLGIDGQPLGVHVLASD